jgi:hypothetical protein
LFLLLVQPLLTTLLTAFPLSQIWRAYLSLPTPLAKEFADQRKKQKEYLAVRRDLNATSSQDEFAKWAKLRRQHDKLLDELEKKSTFFLTSISVYLAYSTSLPPHFGRKGTGLAPTADATTLLHAIHPSIPRGT